MNAADRRRLSPVLGGIAAVLALLLIALWAGLGRGVHWRDDVGAPRLPPAGSAVPAPEIPGLAQFATIWERPLFSQTRSPEPATDAGQASGDLQLTGVILLPDLKLAIVHDKTTGRDYQVVQGQPAGNGPTLVELKPRSAVVDASGSRLRLQLIPGPSPVAANLPGSGEPGQAAEGPDSGMVTPPEPQDSASGAQSREARLRALKARTEAARHRNQQQLDDGG